MSPSIPGTHAFHIEATAIERKQPSPWSCHTWNKRTSPSTLGRCGTCRASAASARMQSEAWLCYTGSNHSHANNLDKLGHLVSPIVPSSIQAGPWLCHIENKAASANILHRRGGCLRISIVIASMLPPALTSGIGSTRAEGAWQHNLDSVFAFPLPIRHQRNHVDGSISEHTLCWNTSNAHSPSTP